MKLRRERKFQESWAASVQCVFLSFFFFWEIEDGSVFNYKTNHPTVCLHALYWSLEDSVSVTSDKWVELWIPTKTQCGTLGVEIISNYVAGLRAIKTLFVLIGAPRQAMNEKLMLIRMNHRFEMLSQLFCGAENTNSNKTRKERRNGRWKKEKFVSDIHDLHCQGSAVHFDQYYPLVNSENYFLLKFLQMKFLLPRQI